MFGPNSSFSNVVVVDVVFVAGVVLVDDGACWGCSCCRQIILHFNPFLY